jgi:hypothetical protein
LVNCFTTANINFCGGYAGNGGAGGTSDGAITTIENIGLDTFVNVLTVGMFSAVGSSTILVISAAIALGIIAAESSQLTFAGSNKNGNTGYSGNSGQGAMILGANCNNIFLSNVLYSGAIITGSGSNANPGLYYSYISGCYWGYSSEGNFGVNSLGTTTICNLGVTISSTTQTTTYENTVVNALSTTYNDSYTIFSNELSDMWSSLSSAGTIEPNTAAYYMLGSPESQYCSIGPLYEIPTNNEIVNGSSISPVLLTSSFVGRTFPLIYPNTITVLLGNSTTGANYISGTPLLTGPFTNTELVSTDLFGISKLGYNLMNNVIGATLNVNYEATNYNTNNSSTKYNISLGNTALVLFPNDAYNYINGELTVNNGETSVTNELPNYLVTTYPELTTEEMMLNTQIQEYAETTNTPYYYNYSVTGYSTTNVSTLNNPENMFTVNTQTGVINIAANLEIGNYIIWFECVQYNTETNAVGNTYTIPMYLNIISPN